MSASEHFVQFYESEIFLLDSLNEFIGAGLSAGDACIVIATKARRETLEEILWVESKKGEGATFHFTLPLFQEGRAKLPPGFVDTRAIDNAQ